jgi:hypothetical protein
MYTHRAQACERACAIARVIKCSIARVIKETLIYGRIIFTFAVNILQVASSSMGYVLFMFMHRAHACAM